MYYKLLSAVLLLLGVTGCIAKDQVTVATKVIPVDPPSFIIRAPEDNQQYYANMSDIEVKVEYRNMPVGTKVTIGVFYLDRAPGEGNEFDDEFVTAKADGMYVTDKFKIKTVGPYRCYTGADGVKSVSTDFKVVEYIPLTPIPDPPIK